MREAPAVHVTAGASSYPGRVVAPNLHTRAADPNRTRERMNTTDSHRERGRFVGKIRESDLEPYTALRWLATLFKAAAIFVAVAVLGEFIAGVRMYGWGQAPMLLGNVAQTVVLGVLLWGGGDLVKLIIQVGNDIRAERILLARLVYRTPSMGGRAGGRQDGGEEGALGKDALRESGDAAEDAATADSLRPAE